MRSAESQAGKNQLKLSVLKACKCQQVKWDVNGVFSEDQVRRWRFLTYLTGNKNESARNMSPFKVKNSGLIYLFVSSLSVSLFHFVFAFRFRPESDEIWKWQM